MAWLDQTELLASRTEQRQLHQALRKLHQYPLEVLQFVMSNLLCQVLAIVLQQLLRLPYRNQWQNHQHWRKGMSSHQR